MFNYIDSEKNARRAKIYEPGELPFWLAIGPILWEGSYNKEHWYAKSILSTGYINLAQIK